MRDLTELLDASSTIRKGIVWTGDSGVGKSTALLAVWTLTGLPARGYLTARLYDEEGVFMGFRPQDAAVLTQKVDAYQSRYSREERLAQLADFYASARLPFTEKHSPPETTNPFAQLREEIFWVRVPGTGLTHIRSADKILFEEALRACLEEAEKSCTDKNKGSVLLLADELGGIELLDNQLWNRICKLRDCLYPMLLVFKSREHLERMSRLRGYNEEDIHRLLVRADRVRTELRSGFSWSDWGEMTGGRARLEQISYWAAALEQGRKEGRGQ